MGTVLIVDREPSFASKLESLLCREPGLEVAVSVSLSKLAEELSATGPHVVVFGPSLPLDAVLEAADSLAVRNINTALVLVVPKVTNELLRRAMRTGFSDVVGADGTFGEVASAVVDAHNETLKRRMASGEAVAVDGGNGRGRVVSVFSTKGGVGKSVIASNLGVALAGPLGLRTVLLDLDLQFGDIGIMLGLKPERTIYDAVQVYDRLDAAMLKGFLTRHQSGLDVLLAPVRPEEAEAITTTRLSRIIGLLRDLADVVVIDTPAAFDETVLTAVDKSDEVYAIATMDVASIKNTRISLQKLKQLGYGDDLIKLVLNRADSKVWLELSEVQHALKNDIVARIPSDRLVPRSVNKGVPVVTDSPKSLVAKSLLEMARMVLPTKEADSDVA